MKSLLKNYQNSSDITKYGNEIKSQDEAFILMTSGTTGIGLYISYSFKTTTTVIFLGLINSIFNN